MGLAIVAVNLTRGPTFVQPFPRIISKSIVGAAALLALSASVRSADAPARRITILHTNDLHGHVTAWQGWEGDLAGRTVGGFDRMSTVVAQTRAEVGGENVLLLDAGDAVGDTMIADLTRGRAVLELMTALRFDAMTLGNHEPDFAADGLRALLGAAKFPALAANVVERRGGKLFTKPYDVRDVGGTKVGILGLAYPNTALTTSKKNVAAFEFGDPVEAARRFIPDMKREGAQLIVALTHLGLGGDRKLAEAVPEIAVIVGGHSHNRMKEALRVGDTLIVQAGAHGSDVGRLDLTMVGGRITAHRRTLITLDHAAVASDAAIAERVASLQRPFRAELDEPLGEAVAAIPRAQTLAGQKPEPRDQESPVDSLFADIIREASGSEVAFLPGVGYGVALARGPITAEALRNLVPHEAKVVTLSLTGAQIREILEQSIENTFSDDPKTKVGGMVQVSGLRFRFDPMAAKGQRVREAHIGGQSLDPQRNYRVATNSMLAEGGHNYRAFLAGRDATERGSQFAMIKGAFKKRGRIEPPPPGRIAH